MKSVAIPLFDAPLAKTIANEAEQRPEARVVAVYESQTGGLYCAVVEDRIIVRWQVIGPLDPPDVKPAVLAFGVPESEVAMFELPGERQLVQLRPDDLKH